VAQTVSYHLALQVGSPAPAARAAPPPVAWRVVEGFTVKWGVVAESPEVV
jgi:hypothetical protein